MRRILLFAFCFMSISGFSQTITTYEKPPVFQECKTKPVEDLKACFNYNLNTFIFHNFKTPDIVVQDNYQGMVQVLFEVNTKGQFNVLYVDAIYQSLKNETNRVFKLLPEIIPATYNGNPTFVQYSIAIAIPLVKTDLKMVKQLCQ